MTAGEMRPGTKDALPGSPSLRGLTWSSPRPAHLQTPGLTSRAPGHQNVALSETQVYLVKMK